MHDSFLGVVLGAVNLHVHLLLTKTFIFFTAMPSVESFLKHPVVDKCSVGDFKYY